MLALQNRIFFFTYFPRSRPFFFTLFPQSRTFFFTLLPQSRTFFKSYELLRHFRSLAPVGDIGYSMKKGAWKHGKQIDHPCSNWFQPPVFPAANRHLRHNKRAARHPVAKGHGIPSQRQNLFRGRSRWRALQGIWRMRNDFQIFINRCTTIQIIF